MGLLWVVDCCKWIANISIFKCSFCSKKVRVRQRLVLAQCHLVMRIFSKGNVNVVRVVVAGFRWGAVAKDGA